MTGAKSGLLQMLGAFGINIDPAEIQAQAKQFLEVLQNIDRQLKEVIIVSLNSNQRLEALEKVLSPFVGEKLAAAQKEIEERDGQPKAETPAPDKPAKVDAPVSADTGHAPAKLPTVEYQPDHQSGGQT